MRADDGRENGAVSPCYLQRDCPLLSQQEAANQIQRDILAETRMMRRALVGAAIGRVPTRVLLWVVLGYTTLLLVQQVVHSGYELDARGAGGSAAIHQPEKKTIHHESE